ncbi:MAG: NIPSNAP family protein [Pedosphaera sp.]|nr:NIPSNAP family protein [Pedosphaera sp.]
MNLKMFVAILAMLLTVQIVPAADTAVSSSDRRVFEMRIYYAPEGKFSTLEGRFRDHTTKLFAKHGIENIGYWVPTENPENKLTYILAYPSRAARDKSWKEFMADPEWQAVMKETQKNGPIVSKAESYFMQLTDYSPSPKLEIDKAGRVFELRTYTAVKGKLGDLNKRFRDHTLGLFQKHGIKNIAYWNLMSDQKNADSDLVCIISHPSKEGSKTSFDSFHKDPAWVAAKANSEKIGGSLIAEGGVKSEFLKATDYSPIK